MTTFATTTWTIFFERCLEERMPASRFASFAKLLHNKHRLASSTLIATLLKTQEGSLDQNDPLVLAYLGKLLQLKYLNTIDLLASLLKSLDARYDIADDIATKFEGDVMNCIVSPILEQSLLVLGVKSLAEQQYAQSKRDALLLFKFICSSMRALGRACSPLSDILKQGVPEDISSWVSAISNLLVVVFQHKVTSAYLDEFLASSTFAKEFVLAVLRFQTVLTRLFPQLSTRIELYIQSQQKMKNLVQKYYNEEGASMTLADLQLQIPDIPATYCRASLVVHISALLHKCPSIDQGAFVAYIQARYKSDFEKSVQDLVLASFDLILLKITQGETEDNLFLIRSFIINKLPLILQSLSSLSLMPLNIAFCISQAMSRVNPATTNREEFLQSCASHGLMTEQNVEQIVGGKASSQPLSKAQKTVLLQQCRAGSQQPEALVARLGDLDGNVSAYAEALADILYNYCTQKHTMPLKSLCHALVSKPTNLDVMVMLVGIERLLQPLCQIIDEWQHEDDHGEYQLSYDEFGACFLLVMACASRFDLTPQDIAAFTTKSFVAEIISNSAQAPRHEDLTEPQQGHLNEWIKALFETEGISDELMSSCPPQDFYRIVATLFRTSLRACRFGAASQEKLHSALELILEPFLLPSVLSVVPWLVKNAWESSDNASGHLIIMQELIKPNPDSTSMRNTVLSAAGSDLMRILNSINDGGENSAKVATLQQTLLPFTNYQRDRLPPPIEATPPLVGLYTPPDDLKAQITGLCAWSVGVVPTPPQYNHSHLLNPIRYSGPTKALKQMVEVIMLQQQAGLGEYALDIVAAIICAFHHGSPPSQKGSKSLGVSLQQALQSELSQAPKFARSEPLHAQILVRLSRRVAAELAPAPTLDLNMDIPDIGDALPLDLASIPSFTMDEMPQLAVPDMEMSATRPVMQEPGILSFDGAADPFSLDIEAAIAAQEASGQDFSAIPGSADDDIFAGLTYDADMDFS